MIRAKEQPITGSFLRKSKNINMGIELIEISDDSCKLKAEQNILKETNNQNIESEASSSSIKSPCRMSNTSFVDQD